MTSQVEAYSGSVIASGAQIGKAIPGGPGEELAAFSAVHGTDTLFGRGQTTKNQAPKMLGDFMHLYGAELPALGLRTGADAAAVHAAAEQQCAAPQACTGPPAPQASQASCARGDSAEMQIANAAFAEARYLEDTLSSLGRAPSPYATLQTLPRARSRTAFAKEVRQTVPQPAVARYLYTEPRRDVLARTVVDVLRRCAAHSDRAQAPRADAVQPNSVLPAPHKFPPLFYDIHMLDARRRALMGCYEQWERELTAWLASALRHRRRTGLTKQDFARIRTAVAAASGDEYVRAVLELFSVLETLVHSMRNVIQNGEDQIADERRTSPYLDAVAGVTASLVQSPAFGHNVYTFCVLHTLIADLRTSTLMHEFTTEIAAEYCVAMRSVLKRIAELPSQGDRRPQPGLR